MGSAGGVSVGGVSASLLGDDPARRFFLGLVTGEASDLSDVERLARLPRGDLCSLGGGDASLVFASDASSTMGKKERIYFCF